MTTPNVALPPNVAYVAVPTTATWELCRCGKRQYWSAGVKFPIDCDVEGGKRPEILKAAGAATFVEGVGVNHFITCPLRDQFRRKR